MDNHHSPLDRIDVLLAGVVAQRRRVVARRPDAVTKEGACRLRRVAAGHCADALEVEGGAYLRAVASLAGAQQSFNISAGVVRSGLLSVSTMLAVSINSRHQPIR